MRQHLSLAAASARIKALEEQAGMALFHREARGVRLTPAGDAFLHHARGVLRQAEQLRAELQEYGGGLRGHLRVYANTTAVMDFLPELYKLKDKCICEQIKYCKAEAPEEGKDVFGN